MGEMTRREFVKNVAIGGAVLGLGGAILQKPLEAMLSDCIGQIQPSIP